MNSTLIAILIYLAISGVAMTAIHFGRVYFFGEVPENEKRPVWQSVLILPVFLPLYIIAGSMYAYESRSEIKSNIKMFLDNVQE